jgi:Ca2+-binding RTX toxin-like protein
MALRRPARIALVCAAFALLLGVVATATNIVPSSRAGSASGARPTANQLKPPECAALDLDRIAVGGGGGGGGMSSLILGGPGNDTLVGAGGNDCIVGGAGNDRLIGNGGTDVCIGGPGNDNLHASCETQIP